MKIQLFAIALLLFTCGSAHGAIELTSYNVTSHTSGPGLLVNATPSSGGPKPLALANAGDSVVVELFKIWTDETSVNIGEDTVAKPISVAFDFKFGSETFDGVVHGQTAGIAGLFVLLPFGAGAVNWATPVEIAFGAGGLGTLRIEFLDQLFNAGIGFGDLTPGLAHGSSVKAKFTLVTSLPPLSAEPGSLGAPEPSALLVWAGLGAAVSTAGLGLRRSNRFVA